MRADDLIGAMMEDLERIHQALRAGRFDDLTGASADLSRRLDALTTADPAAITLLQQKAARVAACLQASAAGLRSARRRVLELLAMDSGMPTYDQTGKRDARPVRPGTLARRF